MATFAEVNFYLSKYLNRYFLTEGVPIRIECRAWARNIQYDRAQGLGSTTFEIMVE